GGKSSVSAALRQTAENFSARYRDLAARLPGPAEPRRRAAAWFEERGLPDTRDEDWRFTNLRPLAGLVFTRPEVPGAAAESLLARLPPTEAPLLVFANGRLDAAFSRLPANGPDGAKVTSFAAAPRFGRPAGSSSDHAPAAETEPLIALNTMFAEDGAEIAIPAAGDGGTLVVVHLGIGNAEHPPALHPRHALHLAERAHLTLIEIALGDGVYLHNPVLEATLAAGATLTHILLQHESSTAFHLASRHITLGPRSSYAGFALNRGSRLARSELHATLAGEGARFAFDAAQILGAEQLADITTIVRHSAPGASSRQTVRNVLTGRAHGVFQGRIAVDRIAQKTDGYQMNKALLLSEEAQINSKPELEIFADDVKCSHGATVGALDPEQLFYLQSRGVPKQEARAMLVEAFLAEMLEAVPHEWGRSVLEAAVRSWWQDAWSKDRPL
ncbi:MAG: Fe-S cluster assembly protein SufD, partial [Acetobacteraceae bacterium]